MRKRRKTVKLQRTASHRRSLLNTLAKQLVEHRRIRTTLAKAKALQPFAEKLLTYGKKAITATGDEKTVSAARVHYSRLAFAKLRDKDLVHKLVHEIAAASKDRVGGYTRITKLGQRRTDSAPMAFIEWVDAFVPANGDETEEKEETTTKKPARGKKAAAKKDEAAEEAEATEEKKPKRASKKKAAAAE